MKKIKSVFFIFSLLFFITCTNRQVNADSSDTDSGNAAYTWNMDDRTINALIKLKNGGNITFSAIGGSITQGGCADGVRDWLQTKARSSGGNITYINAGIGSSDSALGLLRLQDHVLRHNPDIVVIEYSVNDGYYYDGNEETYNRTYEGLVRQSLNDSSRAVFLLLLHTDAQGADKFNPAHDSQIKIGNNYKLPVFKWMDYEKSVTDWKDSGLYRDGTHPNAEGNSSVAKGITDYLDKVWESLPGNPVQFSTDLPEAQFFSDFDKISFIKWGDAGVTNGGWTQFSTDSMVPPQWNSLSSDSFKNISGFTAASDTNELTIKFKGTSVYIISTFTGSGAGKPGGWDRDGGRAWVETAEGNTQEIIAGSGSWWSGPEWFGIVVAGELDPEKEHTLHIKGSSNGAINIWGAVVGVEP